jgi:hypothetical protein
MQHETLLDEFLQRRGSYLRICRGFTLPERTPVWIYDLVDVDSDSHCIVDESVEKPSLDELRKLGEEFGCQVILDETEPAIRLSDEIKARIDAWAAQQKDRPSRSEAIRTLIERGLKRKP